MMLGVGDHLSIILHNYTPSLASEASPASNDDRTDQCLPRSAIKADLDGSNNSLHTGNDEAGE